jgi:transcriptional regulator with XRE-family HTH domain
MPIARTRVAVEAQRANREAVRGIGAEIRRQREDAGISQVALSRAAGISPSMLSRIEAAFTQPSLAVLARIGAALGGRLRVRIEPATGSPLRDHLQARMVEELLLRLDLRWNRFLEVPVHRPVRGVIDAVLDHRTGNLVAVEVHSQIRRLEEQIRWANEKAAALVDTDIGRAAIGTFGAPPSISRLLVLRSPEATRELARRHASTLEAAYPAKAKDVAEALMHGDRSPGSGIMWASVDRQRVLLLGRPPRGVRLGR